jgi:transcriptional accessory protein Tex/SPT6
MNEQDLIAAETEPELELPQAADTETAAESPVEPATPVIIANGASGEASTPTQTNPDNDAANPISILQLQRGQHFSGNVKNIARFGAFVDIGLPQDGLVHISELARQKVDRVEDVVSVGQAVDVWVKKVDKKRGRISLTMVKPITLRMRDIVENAELDGIVTRLEPYGAFVNIGSERDGLGHISQVTHVYIKHPADALAIGDAVKVKVLKVNRKKRQVDLSIKALLPPPKEEVIEESQVVEPVVAVKEVETVVEEESVPTAMAIALAALQNKDKSEDSSKESSFAKEKQKRKQELDDVLTRTLATSD